MADEIKAKRKELKRLYDELEKLEQSRVGGKAELVKECRAKTRRLTDEIGVMEATRDA